MFNGWTWLREASEKVIADKGVAMVVMVKKDYMDKAKNLVELLCTDHY